MQNNFEKDLLLPEQQQYEEQGIYSEDSLRPKDFSSFIGQKSVVETVDVMINSALQRNAALDHILFSGPPGLGKTSLAYLLASKLNSKLHLISGPALEKKGDLAAVLANIAPRDIIFIDEIHRMPITIEELLYSALEDFRLDIILGQGPSARTMQIPLNPFTLIGATTKSGLLSGPLRDRFQAHLTFDFYEPKELICIISNNAEKLKMKIDNEGMAKIAFCSRGTPRIALRILRRVRDYYVVYFAHLKIVDITVVNKALEMLNIDANGLDKGDRKLLKTLNEVFKGGPVGIEALAATLVEDKDTIESIYEPYLLNQGYLIRTPRGRQLSEKAIKYLTTLNQE